MLKHQFKRINIANLYGLFRVYDNKNTTIQKVPNGFGYVNSTKKFKKNSPPFQKKKKTVQKNSVVAHVNWLIVFRKKID